ncbi:MAG TPA: DUF3035 domain-containing protein [Rhizomicrobium sp.]|nr:DUF3035 domain-containing protein [Rhizomicrobium sp.]
MERMIKALPVAALACAAIALSGCDSIRSAAGMTKAAPDEFAVVTKAPLIMPPDYNLRPPRPGAPPLNQTLPTQAAEASLFSSDPAAVASTITGKYSQGEKLLLANAGAAQVSPTIRQQIAADNANLEASDSSFTDRLLFSTATDKNGHPVNADAEAERLGKRSTEKMSPQGTADQDDPTANNDDDSDSDDDSGWFSWLGL